MLNLFFKKNKINLRVQDDYFPITKNKIKKLNVRFNSSFGRHLEYYTGLVFKIDIKSKSEKLNIRGGRYDSLIKDLGFKNVILKYADRPPVRVGDDKVWDKAEASLLEAVKASKLEYTINKGEGAFYGPKIEFVLRDAIGRDWQCGTLQVDLNLPGRLDASYAVSYTHLRAHET